MDKSIYVVNIISDCRIVLNVGEIDGIKIGDKFLVYSLSKEDIIDPITKKSLGKLEIVKGKGSVVHVQSQMCTIESLHKEEKTRIIKRDNPFLGCSLSTMFSQETEEKNIEITIPFENPKVGDLAKEI